MPWAPQFDACDVSTTSTTDDLTRTWAHRADHWRAAFLFDNESDGESLSVTEAAWVDPFSEPLSPENQEFVERSGKWTAFDVSTLGQWAKLIGERLSGAEAITNDGGKTTGIVLRTERGGALRLGVMADELFVDGFVTAD